MKVGHCQTPLDEAQLRRAGLCALCLPGGHAPAFGKPPALVCICTNENRLVKPFSFDEMWCEAPPGEYMTLMLAPMEGLVDPIMRDVLTRIGGIDLCVTEFVRVTNVLLPVKTFHRLSPELRHDGKTRAGVPVRVQLLGSDPACLAQNAARAAELGAPAVDLNFGCPAPTVNRHRGGAVLLDEPELLHAIVAAVRAAVPERVPVTAKMRLGYADKSKALECAAALASAGAAELVVHARTKVEGYRPPAHWEWIDRIREHVQVPVIANGEVWSLDDYAQIRAKSGCDHVMIGRGLIASPDLASRIGSGRGEEPMPWSELLPWLQDFLEQCIAHAGGDSRYPVARLKQWLGQLKRTYPEAGIFFDQIRRLTDAESILGHLRLAIGK